MDELAVVVQHGGGARAPRGPVIGMRGYNCLFLDDAWCSRCSICYPAACLVLAYAGGEVRCSRATLRGFTGWRKGMDSLHTTTEWDHHTDCRV